MALVWVTKKFTKSKHLPSKNVYILIVVHSSFRFCNPGGDMRSSRSAFSLPSIQSSCFHHLKHCMRLWKGAIHKWRPQNVGEFRPLHLPAILNSNNLLHIFFCTPPPSARTRMSFMDGPESQNLAIATNNSFPLFQHVFPIRRVCSLPIRSKM